MTDTDDLPDGQNFASYARMLVDYRTDDKEEQAEVLDPIRDEQFPPLMDAYLDTADSYAGVSGTYQEAAVVCYRYWMIRDSRAAISWSRERLSTEVHQQFIKEGLAGLAEQNFEEAIVLAETHLVSDYEMFGGEVMWPDNFYQLALDESHEKLVGLIKKTAARGLLGFWGAEVKFPDGFNFARLVDELIHFEDSLEEHHRLVGVPRNFLSSWAKQNHLEAYRWLKKGKFFKNGDNTGHNNLRDFFTGFCETGTAEELVEFGLQWYSSDNEHRPYWAMMEILAARPDVRLVRPFLEGLPIDKPIVEHVYELFDNNRASTPSFQLVQLELLKGIDPKTRFEFLNRRAENSWDKVVPDADVQLMYSLGHTEEELRSQIGDSK